MGTSRSDFRAFPTLDVVTRLLKGESMAAIAADLGMTRQLLWHRLDKRGIRLSDLERFRPLLHLVPEASAQLEAAMAEDGLLFVDAFDIAMEYQPRRKAA